MEADNLTLAANVSEANFTANDSEASGDRPVTYKFVVEVFLMPAVSLLGLAGNSLSFYVLRQREVKLRKDFVDILCALAAYDCLLLVRK